MRARAAAAGNNRIGKAHRKRIDQLLEANKPQSQRIVATNRSAAQLLRALDEKPDVTAGHSLGEYSAHVCAETLALEDAVRLVRQRGMYMQEAVPVGEGAMAAVLGGERALVSQACEGTPGVVEPVNFNCPGQIVIAGAKAAVERASEIAKAKGAKRAVLLPVSAPFHCALMRPAAERLAERLAGVAIVKPEIEVINNVDVAVYDDPEKIRDALVRQAFSPVRWIELVQAMAACGMSHVIECGPGKVLAGMTKRIAKDVEGGSAHDAASLEQAIAAVR